VTEFIHLKVANSDYPYRVLIVDDDLMHRTLEREILQPPKYIVCEASNGEEAMDYLKRQSFDVVLLDRSMPGMDGDQVCRRLRYELKLLMLPVIMVTGSNRSDELQSSLQSGATDFIRKPYSPVELTARVDAAVNYKRRTDQLDDAESVLFALARMVEAKDGTTGDHCTRLSHNSVVFGQRLGLSSDELLALRRGGVLHDIGKLGIPDAILLKPGKLTEVEWQSMHEHTTIGARLVSSLQSMQLTVPIVYCHHERWDGSGYPQGLSGENIPFLARVFQIVDIYDALAFQRPYKPALSQQTIIDIFHDEVKKGWRQPDLVQAFLELLQNQPESLQIPMGAAEDLGASLYHEIARSGTFAAR